jgi:hypothetical protein
MRGTKIWLLAGFFAVLALTLPGAAKAAAPTLQSVSFDNATHVLSVSWSLPPGVQSRVLEANTNPATDSEGYFLYGPNDGVYGSDVIFESIGISDTTTSWVHAYPDLPSGTYYLHVAGYDSTCLPCAIREWSAMATFTVGGTPPSDSTPSDYTGAVGQGVTLDDEQVHTVVGVQRWYGGGSFLPPAGKAAVAVHLKIQALQKTSYNTLYYSLEGKNKYGRVVIGYRYPSLGSSNDLMPSKTVDGWVTFLVPTKELSGLKLVYHMHSGFGSTLTVPLGKIPDSPRATLGKTSRLAGEVTVKATKVQRPAGFSIWKPKAGHVFVTTYVRVKALKATKTGSFTAFTKAGKTVSGMLIGERRPAFREDKTLRKGKTAKGWVTLMVPKAQSHGLTLVYHLTGNRDTLLIRLPG